MFDFDLMRIVAGLPGLLIALVVHEYAHARAAVAMGDPTPAMMGRLTLNPKAHIDPIGLVMLLIAQFGWAKPVMYNPRNFKDWRKGDVMVALAGPAANLIAGFLAMLALGILHKVGVQMTVGIYTVLMMIVLYNVNFAIFNLLPIPPLDGSRVLMATLPYKWAYKLAELEQYSFIILVALMMTPILGNIIIPISSAIRNIYMIIINIVL